MTDIEDSGFLAAFREWVESAFARSEAVRSRRFRLVLRIGRIAPVELYPNGAPQRGTLIDTKAHVGRFPAGALVLTTGGKSTHTWVGRSIVLGPNPVTRRTLAHEFGHLLGFDDKYVRGYDGEPRDPFGVVVIKWTGLTDNLMGNPGVGRVTGELIDKLIRAYRPQ